MTFGFFICLSQKIGNYVPWLYSCFSTEESACHKHVSIPSLQVSHEAYHIVYSMKSNNAVLKCYFE